MEYSESDKHNAQQLRILFAVYKQGWTDAIQSMRAARNRELSSIDATLAWLNEIPAPQQRM